jgi:PhnB protein
MPIQMNPYLNFNGQCEAAFKFYEKALGGKILHALLTVGDKVLMGSDAPPDHYERPQGISVSLGIENPADAERIFHALAENGTVRMPIQETFWAQRFGILVDQFDTPWMINCQKPA